MCRTYEPVEFAVRLHQRVVFILLVFLFSFKDGVDRREDTARSDTSTHIVAHRLSVQTISRSGFWSTPATYDLGHAISDNDGTFRIPATPRRVLNASEPEARLQFGIFAMGYNPAWIFFERDVQPFTTPVRISRLDSVAPRYLIANPCSPVPYTWPTCQRIRKHLNLPANAPNE